jgi:hypothetical protein
MAPHLMMTVPTPRRARDRNGGKLLSHWQLTLSPDQYVRLRYNHYVIIQTLDEASLDSRWPSSDVAIKQEIILQDQEDGEHWQPFCCRAPKMWRRLADDDNGGDDLLVPRIVEL